MSTKPPAATRLLVVEDDEDVRTSLVQVLQDEGYLVSQARNGRDAVETLSSTIEPPPDLILLDMMMPVMDGWAFLEEQAGNRAWAAIPVLILSASGGIPIRSAPSGLLTAALKKPFPLERLLSEVARLCSPPAPPAEDK